jgi:hypothetical protein
VARALGGAREAHLLCAMTSLVAVDDVREVAAKRELYRRLARTATTSARWPRRVWYSVLKER